MLSALAKYIFGGIMNDAQEESTQCETREVNDWLLINMPDQTVDDVDFDSDDEKGPESEDELEEIADDKEEDDDDILTSLPLLLAQDKNDCDMIPSENLPSLLRIFEIMDTHEANQYILPDEHSESFQIAELENFKLPESMSVNPTLYYPSDYRLMMALRSFRDACIQARKEIQEQFEKEFHQSMITETTVISSPKTTVQPIVFPRIHKSNVLLPKEDLVAHIKQLKPSQKAMQRDQRKLNSRSYLNRQNKNYIYESSVKTNRRSNLQRHHSGANNNRRC